AGSLGIDLETAVGVILIHNRPQKIPTTFKSPVHSSKHDVGALLLGCSSAGLKGILVIPGLIDADYTRVIPIVVYTLHLPLFIPQASKIAQIISFQNLVSAMMKGSKPMRPMRRDTSFGSTRPVAYLTLRMHDRPVQKITIINGKEQINIQALLDTGEDITTIS
ncbi:POK9 protein, partial [Poecile atricapillus]|nr:POK9 protein [Poecile atricapillus]